MLVSQTSLGYSTRVRLVLFVADQSFPLAQIGGKRLVFDHPIALPGTHGEVVAHIDEHEQHWAVSLIPSDTPRRIIPVEFTETSAELPAGR